MIPKELIKKVRKLEIVTRRRVDRQLAGAYHSVFKGRGMDFDEVRTYYPGDDPRSIEWNVSARMNGLFIKRFKEERELTVMLVVDVSASQGFGTTGDRKRGIAAELGAVLALSAIANNDRVGLVMFTDKVEEYVPPKRGRKHVLRVITEILSFNSGSAQTGISDALQFATRVNKRKAVIFVISDFLDEGYEHALSIAGRRHDLIPIVVSDPMEAKLPNIGLAHFQDPETGQIDIIDTGSRAVRDHFRSAMMKKQKGRERTFKKLKMDVVKVRTDQPYIDPLAAYFKLRASRY